MSVLITIDGLIELLSKLLSLINLSLEINLDTIDVYSLSISFVYQILDFLLLVFLLHVFHLFSIRLR